MQNRLPEAKKPIEYTFFYNGKKVPVVPAKPAEENKTPVKNFK